MSKEREALRELVAAVKRLPDQWTSLLETELESARTVLQSQEGSEPVAALPKYLPLDIAHAFMTDRELAEYDRPGGSTAPMVRVHCAWLKVLERYAASESQEAGGEDKNLRNDLNKIAEYLGSMSSPNWRNSVRKAKAMIEQQSSRIAELEKQLRRTE